MDPFASWSEDLPEVYTDVFQEPDRHGARR